jgi:thymidylate synthase
MIPAFNSIDELQLYLLKHLKQTGDIVTARGFKTIELNSTAFKLNNIRKRCTTLTGRNWSLNFAIGEFAWHLSGSNKLNVIEHYAKEWRNSSPDGQGIYESCYGYKIFLTDVNNESQWSKIIKLLKHDPYTRRAVLNLYNGVAEIDSKDVACTCSIQFLFRNNKLDATIYMRSNDLIWGLPNDIFFFTMLQERLANELKVEAGSYTHMVGSLHLYERHFNLADRILKLNTDSLSVFEMPRMTDISEIEEFVTCEKKIRKGELKSFEQLAQTGISLYWRHLLQVLLVGKLGELPEVFGGNPYFANEGFTTNLANRKVTVP